MAILRYNHLAALSRLWGIGLNQTFHVQLVDLDGMHPTELRLSNIAMNATRAFDCILERAVHTQMGLNCVPWSHSPHEECMACRAACLHTRLCKCCCQYLLVRVTHWMYHLLLREWPTLWNSVLSTGNFESRTSKRVFWDPFHGRLYAREPLSRSCCDVQDP